MRVLVLLVALLGGAVLFAAPASAHASLVTSDPRDGTRLNAAPHTVTITFDEQVGLGGIGYLHVTDQSGKRVDARAAYHPNGDGTKVADDLTSGLGDGSYTASFRVVSADSHPVAGAIAFVVGNGALVRAQGSGGATVNHVTSVLFDVSRWISYAGLALLGGAWLLLTIWPQGRDDRRALRIVWTGWGAACVGALLELVIQGPYAAGTGVSTRWNLLDDTLHTNYGQLHCLRLVLLGAVAFVFARSLQAGARPARWEAVTALFGLGLVWTFSDTGHAATTSPSWLSVPVDMLHLLAMGAWIGGLVLLVGAVLPRREPDELETVLPVFSTVAFVSVSVLAVTGTYAAWRGIGTVDAILTTTYGLIVLCKVVLFLALIALGNFSRQQVRRRTVAYAMTADVVDAPPAPVRTEPLRRSVLVEAAVGLAVLGFSAVLVSQPRGEEALVAQYRDPVSAHASLGGGRTVTVTATPGTHGRISFGVDLSAGARPTKVVATATQKAKQLGPLPITLTRESNLSYSGSATLPVAGTWDIDLVVTTSSFDATTTDLSIDLH